MSSAMTRRRLLGGAAVAATAAASLALPANVRTALAATAGQRRPGTLNDIKHVVILMQENRSFDHYFGTMKGVRGFSDENALQLSTGNSVFYQPYSSHTDGYLLPFHYDTKTTSAAATPGLAHDWGTQHQAWNNGKMDQWIAAKGPNTMGYFEAADIPFHTALAEAFTICDNYHCSMLGPTNPNRLYMWSGWVDPQGTAGGPISDNSPAYNNPILSWITYPERLTQAGVTWQVYQEEDNYDDNALEWFKQFAEAPRSSELYQRGMTKKSAGWFEYDAMNDRLPQVSWLVAPSAQTEHPDWTPAGGAEYIASKLNAIAANPDVWNKTLFILTYDENDGMFDHVAPPVTPAGTPDEFIDGVQIGPGFRVPAIVVSPWTAGGYVDSTLMDHTSLIRILERRFGVAEPHISAYRRSIMGDFTTSLQFHRSQSAYPAHNKQLQTKTVAQEFLDMQQQVADNPAPTVPTGAQTMPKQG